MKKFKRIDEPDAILAGVCSGLAYSLGIPTWIIQLIWFCAFWFYGSGLFLYILLWIFVPEWKETPVDFESRTT